MRWGFCFGVDNPTAEPSFMRTPMSCRTLTNQYTRWFQFRCFTCSRSALILPASANLSSQEMVSCDINFWDSSSWWLISSFESSGLLVASIGPPLTRPWSLSTSCSGNKGLFQTDGVTSLSSRIILAVGSSLTIALQTICFARSAYRRVLCDSKTVKFPKPPQRFIIVDISRANGCNHCGFRIPLFHEKENWKLACPPRDSLKSHVNADSRYGIKMLPLDLGLGWLFFFFFFPVGRFSGAWLASARAEITYL